MQTAFSYIFILQIVKIKQLQSLSHEISEEYQISIKKKIRKCVKKMENIFLVYEWRNWIYKDIYNAHSVFYEAISILLYP
jgi:hypothetical protein